MRTLLLPPLVAAGAGAVAVLQAHAEDAELGRRVAVAGLWLSAAFGAVVAARAPDDGTWGALSSNPVALGAGVLAAAGAAQALGRWSVTSRDDGTPAFVCAAVAASFLALESRYVVPCLLYLSVPIAAVVAAKRTRRVPLATVGVAVVVLALGLGALRHSRGGWALPFGPGGGAATAGLALVASLGLVAGGCLLGATRDGRGDPVGAALGWPLIAVGTYFAMVLAGVAGPGRAGAAPGALVVLALSAAMAISGPEVAPFSAACLATGVALAPGCGPASGALVGAGAFAGILLEQSGPETLRRYGRWCRSGLPGGAVFPGLAAAVLALARAPAPAPGRATVVAALAVAALAHLAEPGITAPRASAAGTAGGVGLTMGALWFATLPAAWEGWAGRGAAAIGAIGPVDVGVFGTTLAVLGMVAVAGGLGASFALRLPLPPPPPIPVPAEMPDWRKRLGRALVRLPRAATLGWLGPAALAVYALIALRLLQVGVRAGFL